MDLYEFYTGKTFCAYEWLGAHIENDGTTFCVFAPNAKGVSVIGDFNNWVETPMEQIYDGNFFKCVIPNAKEGMKYKLRVHENSGRFLDRSDPYGFAAEQRPQTASIISKLNAFNFTDERWMLCRTDKKSEPLNIYELHLGSWKENMTYRSIAEPLIKYVKEQGYNCIEFMPLCEYPCDESWGYQAVGFYSPTSRYGSPNDLKYLINLCHKNNVAVILDFAPAHFAVDDFGLSNFDGTALYEYPHSDIGYNEWGSKNFNHTRGEVRSYLQSAVMYWLKEYHFDGIRMDAIRNILYWQGNTDRGKNLGGIYFLKYMNNGIKSALPNVMLIAEDSSAFPKVTESIKNGGLGFDYKWDMGWMNDTLAYFRENTQQRINDYHKLTFSMHYYYHENFLLPLSHDEVVHGKATILQKMNGQYNDKFPQARALYLYMYAHPGKKLNFMGNEFGQLREWDEKRAQDWDLLKYPVHDAFHAYMKQLCNLYLNTPALYEQDFNQDGFVWLDCKEGNCIYAFLRCGKRQTVLAIFNFADVPCENYTVTLEKFKFAKLIMDSNWEQFGGNILETPKEYKIIQNKLSLNMEQFSGKLFILDKKKEQPESPRNSVDRKDKK